MSHTTANKGSLLPGLTFRWQGSAHKAVPERSCLSQWQPETGGWTDSHGCNEKWEQPMMHDALMLSQKDRWTCPFNSDSLTCKGLQHSFSQTILQVDIAQWSSYAHSSRAKSWKVLSTSEKQKALSTPPGKHISFQILSKPYKPFLMSRSFCSQIPTVHSQTLASLQGFGHTPALSAVLPPEPWAHPNLHKFNTQFKKIISLCI